MTLRAILFFGLFLYNLCAACQSNPRDYASLIIPEDLKENLNVIASDALEGRETGTRGQKMAAAFISYHFEELGLKPPVNGSFYQPFDLYKTVPGEVELTAGGLSFKNFQDILYYGKDNSGGDVQLTIVFAGMGRADDYNQLDVAGHGVLIMAPQHANYREAVGAARSQNAAMVFVLNTKTAEEFKDYAHRYEKFLTDERLALKRPQSGNATGGMFFVSPLVAEKIFNTTIEKLSAAARSEERRVGKERR